MGNAPVQPVTRAEQPSAPAPPVGLPTGGISWRAQRGDVPLRRGRALSRVGGNGSIDPVTLRDTGPREGAQVNLAQSRLDRRADSTILANRCLESAAWTLKVGQETCIRGREAACIRAQAVGSTPDRAVAHTPARKGVFTAVPVGVCTRVREEGCTQAPEVGSTRAQAAACTRVREGACTRAPEAACLPAREAACIQDRVRIRIDVFGLHARCLRGTSETRVGQTWRS
jgi:hypothetical protein